MMKSRRSWQQGSRRQLKREIGLTQIMNKSTVAASNEQSAIIFNIQRYSIHDGSGIRTLVFIKGCPLRCQWCSNPESQKAPPQLSYVSNKCTGDGDCRRRPCIEACPQNAIAAEAEGKVVIDRDKCDDCGQCETVCLWEALRLLGEEMTVEEVMAKVERDRAFFEKSGGGVTLGGGEPTTAPAFSATVLKRCKALGLSTAIETCLHTPWENLEKIIPYTDLIYCDIKHMDPRQHKDATGVTNSLILENAKRLLSLGTPTTIVRVPLIPGFNADGSQIRAIASFVKASGGKRMELLPYHRFGSSKYRQIGKSYLLDDLTPLEEEEVQRLRGIVFDSGLEEITGEL
jgi:pyruvate formate lyase activating enzyme